MIASWQNTDILDACFLKQAERARQTAAVGDGQADARAVLARGTTDETVRLTHPLLALLSLSSRHHPRAGCSPKVRPVAPHQRRGSGSKLIWPAVRQNQQTIAPR